MPTEALKSLSCIDLLKAVSEHHSAVRLTTRLMPAGGPGDKVFPPTYEGGRYAFEQRRVDGRVVDTVLLDSVQSQANRMEQALKARAAAVGLPYLQVVIPRTGTDTTITTLDAPHRVWDAIFRDSLWEGKPFRMSPEGARLVRATPGDATAFYEYAPTALIFGMWDSTSGEGGTGKLRWARALVSEVVGLDVVRGRKTSSRIDPLGITADAARIYRSDTDGWTLDEKAATKKGSKPELFGKDSKAGKPSAVNHGNVTPSISGDDESGGVTMAEARQTAVLSIPQLRRLWFPAKGGKGEGQAGMATPRDIAGRTALAALALYALATAAEDGYCFRSRCQLVPVAAPAWELVGTTTEDVRPFSLDVKAAGRILREAVDSAAGHGLTWPVPVTLKPAPKLVELVRRSDEKVRVEGAADAGD